MKKLFFRLSSGGSHSHDVSSFIGVKFLSSSSTCLAQFLFNSDDDTEIYSYSFLIEVRKELEFMREVQDNLSFSKKDSVVIFDDVDEYCVSRYADPENTSLARNIIPSPSILNGDLITNLSTDFNVTAGDITAVANLISTNDAQIDGNTDIGGILDVTGNILFSSSIVDSSGTTPTVASDGAGTVTISGTDNCGVITLSGDFSAVGGQTITVTFENNYSPLNCVPVISDTKDLLCCITSVSTTGFSFSVNKEDAALTSTIVTYHVAKHN